MCRRLQFVVRNLQSLEGHLAQPYRPSSPRKRLELRRILMQVKMLLRRSAVLLLVVQAEDRRVLESLRAVGARLLVLPVLHEIGEPLMVHCRPAPDTLPPRVRKGTDLTSVLQLGYAAAAGGRGAGG